MSNNKITKENRDALKNEIESLLSSISSKQNDDLLVDRDLSDEISTNVTYDFEKISNEYTSKAREITDSLFNNFVDIGIFEKNDYARHKKELDTINISNLFFQLRTLKITIMKVMEEISSGNTNPRLIEVMGNLQDKMANITRMQANYVIFLEDTYKKMNDNSPVNSSDVHIESSSSEGQFFVSVGTKNIIDSLKDIEVTDIDLNASDSDLIDPSNKTKLLKSLSTDVTIDDDINDDSIDLEEII